MAQLLERRVISPAEIIMLVGVTISVFVVTGTGASSFGLLINPLKHDLSWTNEQVSRLPGIYFLASALASLGNGWLLDRWGPRRVLLAGLLVDALGLYCASLSSSMPVMLAAFALAGIGNSASYLVFTYLFMRSAAVGPALAMGIFICGASAGAAIMPIGMERVIVEMGWQVMLQASALVLVLVLMPLAILVTRFSAEPETDEAEQANSTRERIAIRPLMLVLIMELLFGIAVMGIYIHFVPLMNAKGIDTAQAVLVLGAASMIGAVTPLLIGWLADRWGSAPVLFVCILVHALAIAALNFLGADSSVTILYGLGLLWGASSGTMGQLAVPIIAQIVPPAAMGRALGFHNLFNSIAAAAGPVAVGALADTPGGYAGGTDMMAALALAAALPLVAVWLMQLRRPSSFEVPNAASEPPSQLA